MTLSLGYVTSRKQPRIEWFLDSIHNQLNGDYTDIGIIVCDFYAQAHEEWTASDATQRRIDFRKMCKCPLLTHVPPKPNIWNGPHRITSKDCWDAAGARNTILCYAKDGCLAFCDDLSLPLPGWIDCVKEAYQKGYVACGCYQKVEKLGVDKGRLASFSQIKNGIDNRLKHVRQDVTECKGGWLYGCSLAGNVESFLKVNGFPQDLSGGLGFEDCCMGIAMENAGVNLKYDRRMITLESQEDHANGKVFFKSDFGKSPLDKSHAALAAAQATKRFVNDFGDGITDIRILRERVLKGEVFPIPQSPTLDWFTGKPLAEL